MILFYYERTLAIKNSISETQKSTVSNSYDAERSKIIQKCLYFECTLPKLFHDLLSSNVIDNKY